MRRQVDVSGVTEQEGLCYDLERAKRDGLVEELTISRPSLGLEVEDVPTEVMDWLIQRFDLSVNIPPGECVSIHLVVDYECVYGEE